MNLIRFIKSQSLMKSGHIKPLEDNPDWYCTEVAIPYEVRSYQTQEGLLPKEVAEVAIPYEVRSYQTHRARHPGPVVGSVAIPYEVRSYQTHGAAAAHSGGRSGRNPL